MLEAFITAGIAALSGVAIMTQRLHTRISELDKRVDSVELKVAENYVTKTELGSIMERMEAHLIRIEDKMDKIANKC